MDNVIDLVNKIQDVFSTIGVGNDSLDLPQIITVGSQSAGKSSVLENIVQRDFLPRGSGIVTRRPLVLQLVTLPAAATSEDYGEFLHVPSKRFYDFQQVREEIEQDTARIAGNNKGISRQPIHLKIYSKKVLNLTMVDLPGLTKIPIGDQPADIEKQIRSLVLDYISKPNSIILAVSPANTDIANSDSLKLARKVDPAGKRTIGVVTKLDLMDAGTNALDILTGRAFPLKLGFVGLVNRSQQDILTNKSMGDALKAEQEFFERHAAYKGIAARCGSAYLAKQLNSILVAHIRDKLPDMRSKLSAMIGQTQHELAQYGDPAFIGSAHKGSLVLKMLTMFATQFTASIDGTSPEISTKELSGGARIYFIFNNIFGHALDAIIPCSNITNDDIRTAIRNSTGPRCSLFVPELAFDLLVRPQIRLLEAPSLRCVDMAFQELSKICHTCHTKELMRFPKLHSKLIDVVSDLLHERLGPTSSYVKSLIDLECAYINTNHPDFPGATGAMYELEKNRNKGRKKQAQQETLKVNGVSQTAADPMRRTERSLSVTSSTTGASASSPSKDSFLNYFFGGAARTDRPALSGAHDKQHAHPMSLATEIEGELESHFANNFTLESGEDLLLQSSDKEDMEVELIRTLIISYFNIVRKTIQDLVPKAIMHLLVNFTRESVQNRLVSELYREDLFSELLLEDSAVAAERTRCKAMLDMYRKAFGIISESI
ncbi:putative dynamin-like GTPase Dnm1 [Zychaea mexicana]|uniref:putative dynamin-like GTPase Dnm1 n=1 Tax=Zychaea mexicana TaxID=64656 RepID=UPI0022FF29AD|nr:putative dynamin-like GTPase Dnm1 [Zychaea mexicana]KAI9484415.1 putative dynamin-like GTPase Dnm1 [Zychaea mexicana]